MNNHALAIATVCNEVLYNHDKNVVCILANYACTGRTVGEYVQILKKAGSENGTFSFWYHGEVTDVSNNGQVTISILNNTYTLHGDSARIRKLVAKRTSWENTLIGDWGDYFENSRRGHYKTLETLAIGFREEYPQWFT